VSHLGARVTALVDGRLTPDATERALAHVAVCDRCRTAVQEERAVRRLLAGGDRPDEPPAALTRALLDLGGPAGPLPPPRPRPPGTGGGPDPLRLPPREPSPRRALAASLGTAVLVAVVAMGVALAATPVPTGTADQSARGVSLFESLDGSTVAPAAVLLADPGADVSADGSPAAEGSVAGAGSGPGSDVAAAEDPAAGGWWARTVRGARVLACLLTAT
jgi:hypothetical protein